jgi:hypothetical protein
MKLLSAIDILSPFMFLAVLIGFVSCVVSLLRTMGGRRKIPYISVSFLLVPLAFFLVSQVAIVSILDAALINKEIRVTVSPPIKTDPKALLREAM